MMRNGHGCTVWFTGLPCSGKTTIAKRLETELARRGVAVELLDGDEIRKHFSAGVGFSKEDRSNHLKRVAYLCHLLTKHGVVVLASFVSPYRENRDYARALIGNGEVVTNGTFVEVYVNCPVEVCIQRDVKGMYKKALAGEIQQFTGVSDPYEEPPAPELVIHSNREPVETSVSRCLAYLEQQGIIPGLARRRTRTQRVKEAAWLNQ